MEIDLAIELVTQDVEDGVGAWLRADADLEIGVVGNVAAADGSELTMVQWVHRGHNHGTDDPFIGLAPKDAVLEVHGITLVQDGGTGDHLFRRYVDWVGVYDQLGLAVSARLPVSELPENIS
jgi:hypothetical protein